LRPRNPAATRFLLITAPTGGYKNIGLGYAVTRTTNGAEYQRIYYTTDNVVWKLKVDSILVSSPETVFGLQTIDFSTDASTAHNPNFAVKIEFFGPNSTGTSGNNRFDNITVTGKKMSAADSIGLQPAVTVVGDKNNICTNSKVTFTATAINAGTDPTFQWIKNGANVGINSNTFSDSSFQNSDAVSCVLTVNAVSFNSNKITMTVVPNSMIITSLTKTAASSCRDDGQIIVNRSGGISPLYSASVLDIPPQIRLLILQQETIRLL
jgi:hypothetical protein